MSWTNICIEAFCFGNTDNNNYPCGRYCPSHLCLEHGQCPHLGYAKTTERETAEFVPIQYIIKDRIMTWADEVYSKLRWWLWDSLPFNRRKTDKFFDNIEYASSEDCPELAEFEAEETQNEMDFKEWFRKVSH